MSATSWLVTAVIVVALLAAVAVALTPGNRTPTHARHRSVGPGQARRARSGRKP